MLRRSCNNKKARNNYIDQARICARACVRTRVLVLECPSQVEIFEEGIQTIINNIIRSTIYIYVHENLQKTIYYEMMTRHCY
jgi:hypothetical protein